MSSISAVLILALVGFQVPADAQVWQFPEQYRFIFTSSSTTVSSTSFSDCSTIVKGKGAKAFFGYDSSQQICQYGSIKGFIYGKSTMTPAALVSTTSTTVVSVTSQVETETYIMNEVYGSNECPPNTTLSGGFCMTTMPNKQFGVYLAGHFANQTILVLSKTQVQDSLRYTCDSPSSIRMTFGSTWYCYTQFTSITSASVDTIKNNQCASLQSGSSVIKLTDVSRECGFLNENKNGFDMFLGLFLPSGVTSSASAFKYFDNSSPGTLPWAPGRPNNTAGSNNLVICDATNWGSVKDTSATSMKALMCKKEAVLLPPSSSTPGTSPSTATSASTPTTASTTTMSTTTTASTTPMTTVPQCSPPNATQVGLIVNIGVTEQVAGVNSQVLANCSCSAGDKRFWNSATQANPTDAGGAGQKAIGVQCTTASQLCVVDDTGATCTPGATAPTTLSIYPFCKGTVCNMYAVQEGPDASSMTCSNGKSFTLDGQFKNADDPDVVDMDPSSSPQAYIHAVAVSCSGCSAIQNDVCTGPAKPTA